MARDRGAPRRVLETGVSLLERRKTRSRLGRARVVWERGLEYAPLGGRACNSGLARVSSSVARESPAALRLAPSGRPVSHGGAPMHDGRIPSPERSRNRFAIRRRRGNRPRAFPPRRIQPRRPGARGPLPGAARCVSWGCREGQKRCNSTGTQPWRTRKLQRPKAGKFGISNLARGSLASWQELHG